MSLSRRKFLTLIGGGVVVAAGAGAVTFANTRTPTKALEPWEGAGQYADPRVRALSYALLAPNPHNRQPWEAELVDNDGLRIWRDKKRDLPVTDPFARQLTVGMGCFLELMKMAAANEGYGVETVLFPDGEDGPVAECRFVANGAKQDPLFAFVMERRSHKAPFDIEKELPQPDIANLGVHATIYTAPAELAELKRHAIAAWETEMSTEAPYMESVHLFRVGKREINANPDGIDIQSPMLDALRLAGQLPNSVLADMSHPAVKEATAETSTQIESSPAIALITTPSNTRLDQLDAGARWLRLNLDATARGIAIRPVSQALQEYQEVRENYDAIHAAFGNGGTVQMLGLLGYGTQTPRTPRWALETRLINA
ncbi:MAG: twin-arginine translocation pathway signal protein [Pseudomonadota bacterium]